MSKNQVIFEKWRNAIVAMALLSALGLLATSLPPASAQSASCPAWAPVATPNDSGADNILTSVSAVSPNEVWAVGYALAGQHFKTLVMRWNGQAWSVVPSPNPGGVDTSNFLDGVAALSANDVWVVGSYGAEDHPSPFILHWDGNTWTESRLPALDPDGNELYAISAVSPTDIWAVGSIGCNRCKTEHSLIMHYNGVDWQTVAQDAQSWADALFAVSARAANDVWAVGYRFTFENGAQPLTQHWDGTSWTLGTYSGLAGRNKLLTAVTTLAPTDAWAVGYQQDGQVNALMAMRWNGGVWANVELTKPSPEGSVLFGVSGTASNDVWAVGYFVASGARRALIMHYDGTNWTQAGGDAGPGATLYVVTTSGGGGPIAVGYKTEGTRRTLVERYTDPCAPPTPTVVPTNPPVLATATTTPASTFAPTPLPGSGSRTFPETGKSVSGLFLDYWDKNGGLPQQGFPISEMFTEVSDLNGKPYTVQYFERAVFEYHPENQAPFNVLLSQLGTFQYRKKYSNGAPGQTPNTSPGSVLFPETGKRLGGKFLTYWREHGGLPQQGYPISDEFTEVSDLNGKPYTVQYFERAVFEDHPENQPPYDVLLSQLGTFQYRAKYGLR